MLKALYDYGVRRQLALPPGFAGKTVKAYISLSENDEHVSIYLGGDDPVPCPDIGSLANGRSKSNVLAEKRSVVVPEEHGSKSTFFLEALRSASEEEQLLKVCVHALETPELAAAIRAELERAKIKPGDRISFRVNGQSILQSEHGGSPIESSFPRRTNTSLPCACYQLQESALHKQEVCGGFQRRIEAVE